MAITYQSIQSNTAASGTTVVVTKPTSLAVGDLMIASSVYSGNSGITLPSGFTTIHSGSVSALRSYITGYKIATAGDVAASNFTFTMGSTIAGATASLIRLSTNNSFPSNPIVSSVNPTNITGTNPSYTLNIVSGPSTTFLVASYFAATSVTSSAQTSSPSRTWTERNDHNVSGTASSIATAPNTAAETLSSFSLTVSSSATGDLSFFAIAEQKTETADVGFQAITPTQFGLTAAVNVNPDIAHQNIPITQFGIAGKASSDGTQWTNETKPTTTWTNDTL
jgi:hypothetical protein